MMILELSSSTFLMELVYSLREELKHDKKNMEFAQKLTLDESKPLLGLKGKYGLFGSDEWWKSIENKKIPLEYVSGIIKKCYVTGQDRGGVNNTVDLILEDGTEKTIGIYVNHKDNIKKFIPGVVVQMVYGFDELKKQPSRDGKINYLRIPLEVAISQGKRAC
ncbi:hypothetical protein L4C36_20105 [Photobacterium japonica]|uniref:hypothetical protein n=1 Tax=Photobacterium japonica TaxID=2910235 RepID=UPI003D0AF1FB